MRSAASSGFCSVSRSISAAVKWSFLRKLRDSPQGGRKEVPQAVLIHHFVDPNPLQLLEPTQPSVIHPETVRNRRNGVRNRSEWCPASSGMGVRNRRNTHSRNFPTAGYARGQERLREDREA